MSVHIGKPVADLRGARGTPVTPPGGPKFFQFHAVFGKIGQNRMLAPPPEELAPPPRGNPGSASGNNPKPAVFGQSGGRSKISQDWGRQPIILQNLGRKLHRNESNWTERGRKGCVSTSFVTAICAPNTLCAKRLDPFGLISGVCLDSLNFLQKLYRAP